MRFGTAATFAMAIVFASASANAAGTTLVPVGGDYNTAADFFRAVLPRATGPALDVAVLPTPYGETRDEAIENGDYDLALSHVADFIVACELVIDWGRFPQGCQVSLTELWENSDADDPGIAAELAADSLDGVFILGGDQELAMLVLAGSRAELALAGAESRGVVVGGTSAGASMLSRNMTDGYTDYGYYSTALHLGALDLWFGSPDPLTRGLSFGSTRALYDQHLYERGRFGRLVNEAARSADFHGRGGLLAIGMDLDTGVVVQNDRYLESVFGANSLSVIDLRTAGAEHAWVDSEGKPVASPSPEETPTAALSLRRGLVHVLAPRASGIALDYVTRIPFLDGHPVWFPRWAGAQADCGSLTAVRPLLLGGDLSVGEEWPTDSKVLREFIARTSGSRPVIIVAAGYDDAETAQADADSYVAALELSGFVGTTDVRLDVAGLNGMTLARAAGVIFLAQDQGQIATLLADRAFVAAVRTAYVRSPIVLLERSIAAMAGDLYNAISDSADWIEAWKLGQAQLQRGLGLIRAARPIAIEPRLQYDYKHGRLFGIPVAAPRARPVVFGISEGAALLVTPFGTKVVGDRPVFRVDTDTATFYPGDNGAFGVLNAVLDVYEPEERLAGRHD